MSDEGLSGLAASIKTAGVMQPIVARPKLDPRATGYEIVAGERRWRAAQLAGLTHVPVIIRPLSDADSAEWALIENVQREDLNPMDRAHALKTLCASFGTTQADVAMRAGLDRSSVANLIRLTELEGQIAELIAKGSLSAGHGKALLSMPAGPARIALAREASDRHYSVRRTEIEAKRRASAPSPTGDFPQGQTPRQMIVRDIERRIAQALGTKVAIHTDSTGKRGQVIISFYDFEQFDGLLARLGIPGTQD